MLFKPSEGTFRKDITIQVTGDCNMACTYCYQHSKNTCTLDINKAKKFIKALVTNDQSMFNGYMDFSYDNLSISLQFIGGEPLVNYKAVIECCDYFKEMCDKYNPEMYKRSLFGICTNGTIYNKEIENLFKRHRGKFLIGVSIDGNKKLHDTCRIFKNSGEPTYDIVVKNLQKFRSVLGFCNVSTKFTVSHENLPYLSDAVIDMYENLHFTKIPCNCVFEDVWSTEDAKLFYLELKKIADYLLSKNIKVDSINLNTLDHSAFELGLLNEYHFREEVDYDGVWCGGNGRMLFMQYDGKLYCCNRYSEISIGNKKKDLYIGNVDTGIDQVETVKYLQSVTRKTMYNDTCKNCPIARGCADCLAYCYEVNGEFKKTTYLCEMHKARSLANVYFWNKYYLYNRIPKIQLMYLPEEDALKYVSKSEYDELLSLSNNRYDYIVKCKELYRDFEKFFKEENYEARKNNCKR